MARRSEHSTFRTLPYTYTPVEKSCEPRRCVSSSASGVDWRGVPAPKLLPLPGGALGGSGNAAPPPGSSAPVYVDAREVAPAHCASDGWRSRAFADGVFADARPEVVAASCVPSFLKKEWDWKRRPADDSRVGVRRDFLGFERRDGDVASENDDGNAGRKARPPAGAAPASSWWPETDAPSPAVR